MEPSSAARAPTVAGAGPDLPVRCLSPAQELLITRLLFAGAQVAWAEAQEERTGLLSLQVSTGAPWSSQVQMHIPTSSAHPSLKPQC